jgi:hypothetical protein
VIARASFARLALAGALALAVVAAPRLVHACAVCSVITSESNRKAFFDTTIFLSLLPLGLIGWGLFWLARKARSTLAAEFRESDEDLPAPAAETPGS